MRPKGRKHKMDKLFSDLISFKFIDSKKKKKTLVKGLAPPCSEGHPKAFHHVVLSLCSLFHNKSAEENKLFPSMAQCLEFKPGLNCAWQAEPWCKASPKRPASNS